MTIDIECSPIIAHVWGLWQNNVSLNQLMEAGEVISFAAKWSDKKKVHFYSTFHHGKEVMVQKAYDLLSEADVVVGYNSKTFDMKHLNREFVEAGFTPPAPYKQVDLLHVVKSQFRFPSNKLDYVVQTLGLGAKEKHEGHTLWVKCMAGNRAAWADMKRYNIMDVLVTEKLYFRLLPWVPGHPAVGLYDDKGSAVSCPNCGGTDLERRGYAYTSVSTFQRFVCRGCGRWSRATKKLDSVETRNIV